MLICVVCLLRFNVQRERGRPEFLQALIVSQMSEFGFFNVLLWMLIVPQQCSGRKVWGPKSHLVMKQALQMCLVLKQSSNTQGMACACLFFFPSVSIYSHLPPGIHQLFQPVLPTVLARLKRMMAWLLCCCCAKIPCWLSHTYAFCFSHAFSILFF